METRPGSELCSPFLLGWGRSLHVRSALCGAFHSEKAALTTINTGLASELGVYNRPVHLYAEV